MAENNDQDQRGRVARGHLTHHHWFGAFAIDGLAPRDRHRAKCSTMVPAWVADQFTDPRTVGASRQTLHGDYRLTAGIDPSHLQ